jgi:tetratricopeptide (TPR) repeat protein
MRRDVGHWAATAVELPGAADHPLWSAACGAAGYLAWERGADGEAARLIEAALAGPPAWVTYDALGTVELFRGRILESIAAYEEAERLAAVAGNDFLRAIAISQRGFAHVFAGLDDAADVVAVAEPIARATGNPTCRAQIAWAMGVAMFDRSPRRALDLLEEAMALSQTSDNRIGFGAASVPAEELRTKLGSRPVTSDLEAALEHVDYWTAMGNAPNVWLTVRRIARDLAGLGQFEAAALAFGAEAEAGSKLPMRAREGDRHEAAMARTRQALGAQTYDAMAGRGASLTPEQLLAELRVAAAEVSAST